MNPLGGEGLGDDPAKSFAGTGDHGNAAGE